MVKNKISLILFLEHLWRTNKAGMEGKQDAWRMVLQMRHVHANAESVSAGAGVSPSQVYNICRGKSRGGQTCAFRKYLDESRIPPDGIASRCSFRRCDVWCSRGRLGRRRSQCGGLV